MAEVQRNFVDANGNHFVAVFRDQAEADAYTVPDGSEEISPPPGPGYIWVDDEWQELPPPPSPMPQPTLYAVAQLIISSGDIGGIDVNSRFSAALYLDVGSYLVFFAEEQPDTSYLAKAYDDAAKVRVTEKTTSYIAITVVDGNGDPVDPDEISVEIIRVN